MEPIKSLKPVAHWLLRIALAIIIYRFYFNIFQTFDLNSIKYYMAFIMVISAVALLVGGTLKKNSITVLSGLIIAVISLIAMFSGQMDLIRIITNFVPGSLGFYFMTSGNKVR